MIPKYKFQKGKYHYDETCTPQQLHFLIHLSAENLVSGTGGGTYMYPPCSDLHPWADGGENLRELIHIPRQYRRIGVGLAPAQVGR